jgi:hypothetical protein
LPWPSVFLGLGLGGRTTIKILAGSNNYCNKDDMNIFYASTSITICNGNKSPFCEAPWLGGQKWIEIVATYLPNLQEEEMES